MNVDLEKEVCYFVGGIGSKAGEAIAGGCTKEWLAAQNGDPSGLFGTDGGCLYLNPYIQIGTNSRITGAIDVTISETASIGVLLFLVKMVTWTPRVQWRSSFFRNGGTYDSG
jgi:hypothetical protein